MKRCRLLQSKRPFFGPFGPDVRPAPCQSGLCSTQAGEGQQMLMWWRRRKWLLKDATDIFLI